jgi:predicted nuclease with RNAse H fold
VAVISVDLAYKRWRYLGIAILTQRNDVIEVSFVLPADGDLAIEPLAHFVESLCKSHGVRLLLLDGPGMSSATHFTTSEVRSRLSKTDIKVVTLHPRACASRSTVSTFGTRDPFSMVLIRL